MTISDMLTSISNTKKAIKSAVVSKGVSIEDNIPFSEYANKISSIPTGSSITQEELDSYKKAAISCVQGTANVVIPVGPTDIMTNAFEDNKSLVTIEFSEGLLKISGVDVFWGCMNLTTITIPSTVTTINAMAFENETGNKLKTINVKKKKDSITGAPWGAAGLWHHLMPQ